MPVFQRTANDKTTRLDKDARKLALVFEENTNIELAGGGLEIVVDSDDPGIVEVTNGPIPTVNTYAVRGARSGTTKITARTMDRSYADSAARRRSWLTMPVVASLDVTVFGSEYRQAGGTWGNLTYGSTNPHWKDVQWTTMAEAGCGPTSLAMVLDYLDRLSPHAQGNFTYAGISPRNTMDYTSTYGRAADDKGVPQGTSGKIMMDNVSRYWPDYTSRPVMGIKDAKLLLRQNKPIVFLARDNVVTWKYENGRRVEMKWPGHFMVVLGYEGDGDPFWIADSSRFKGKFISASELAKCSMWLVERWADAKCTVQ